MTVGIGRYLSFIEVLRGEGDPNGQVSVKKADGTFLNVAPLSTLLREWDELERYKTAYQRLTKAPPDA